MAKVNMNRDQFVAFVRVVLQAAKDHRVIYYSEIANLTGVHNAYHSQYACWLGLFCEWMEWPALNALIVNEDEFIPSDPFWQRIAKHKNLAKCWCECWQLGKKLGKRKYVTLASSLDEFIRTEV